MHHGRVPLSDLPLQKIPWWWSQIAHHETRLQQILELAALDEDHQPPPREYWYSGARKDLELWIDQRTHKDQGR